MTLAAVKKEDALHRAFQLQPEMVLGERAWLLDLDCLNCNTRNGVTRPDGLAALKAGRLAVVELKLDVKGTRDTSAASLAESAFSRLHYVISGVGTESIKRMRNHYVKRFVSEDKTAPALPETPGKDPCKPIYVIAARSFAPGVAQSILEKIKSRAAQLPSFELLIVQLAGSVNEFGRVHLEKALVLEKHLMGSDSPARCSDNVYPGPQHLWCAIPAVAAFESLLQKHRPGTRLRSKHSHVGKWPIGMLHVWGVEAGDVAFEIDLSRGKTHCQFYLGKRADISEKLRPLLTNERETIAQLAGVPPASVEMPRSGNYLFKVNYQSSDSTRIAKGFAAVVDRISSMVGDYVW